MTEPTPDAAPVETPVEPRVVAITHEDLPPRVKQLLMELENAAEHGRDFAVKAAKDELAKLRGAVETTQAP